MISRHHARIRVAETGALIEDVGSKNGTYVKQKRAEGPTPLADGDEISVGSAVLIFRAGGSLGSTETEGHASR